jgi:hypothetical protein
VKLWLTRWIAAQTAAAAAHVRFRHFAGAYVALALAQASLDSAKDLYYRVVQVCWDCGEVAGERGPWEPRGG